MRILVVSDSHGRSDLLRAAVRAEGNFAMLIHLGDGAGDLQAVLPELEGKPFLQVRGNCDFAAALPETIMTEEGGKRILCTHGHRFSVKYGEQMLEQYARGANVDIALYGHTHTGVQHYADGLYICNPGALMMREYAVLEILPQGVLWLPKKVKQY